MRDKNHLTFHDLVLTFKYPDVNPDINVCLCLSDN